MCKPPKTKYIYCWFVPWEKVSSGYMRTVKIQIRQPKPHYLITKGKGKCFQGRKLFQNGLPPFYTGVCSKKQEFAPSGSKFLPFRVDPFWKGEWCSVNHKGKQEVTKVVSLVKWKNILLCTLYIHSTPQLLTILVPKFEQVQLTRSTRCCVLKLLHDWQTL